MIDDDMDNLRQQYAADFIESSQQEFPEPAPEAEEALALLAKAAEEATAQ